MTNKITKSNMEEEGFLERLGKRIDQASVWHKRIGAIIALIVAFSGVATAISASVNGALDSHIAAHTDIISAKLDDTAAAIQNNAQEIEKIRMDTLRVQLLEYIFNEPTAHETILKLAYTYFVEYQADWVMTDKFREWADEQHVNIPFDLQH